MPFKSEAQRRWAHTPVGMKKLGGEKSVKEWDEASKGMSLPERVGPHPLEKLKAKRRR